MTPRFLPTPLALLIAASSLTPLVVQAADGTEQVIYQSQHRFLIPAQPLHSALTRLADQADLQLLIRTDQITGQSRAVQGSLSVEQALQQLLGESGYRYELKGRLLKILPAASARTTRLESLEVVGDWLVGADPQQRQSFAGARSYVEQAEIQASGASNLKDGFRRVPGVQAPVPVETDGSNASLSVGIRGLKSRFTSTSTVLLDGVPLSQAPYGQPQLSMAPVALNNLAAIDVVKGGASVRYGPQNVGGVINFVTKPIPEQLETELSLRTEGLASGGRDNSRQITSLTTGGYLNESTGLQLSYSGSHGEGFRDQSDESIDDVMLKAEHWLDAAQQLSGHLHYFNAEADIPGGLSTEQYYADPFQSRYPANQFNGWRKEAALKYSNFIDSDRQLEVQTFYTNTFREYGLQFNPDIRTRYDEWPREYKVFGIEPRYSQLFRLDSSDHEVSIGYRFVYEEAELKRFRWNNFADASNPKTVTPQVRNIDEAGTRAHAFYIDDRISVGNWTITPGIRFEHVEVERDSIIRRDNPNGFVNRESFTEWLPSISASYALTPAWTLFSSFNTSFGTVQHLQLSDIADNELEPEIAHTIELGARYEQDGLKAEATLFNIDFSNKIEFDDDLAYALNRGKTHHYGIELSAGYTLPGSGLSLYGNYAWTRAEFESGTFAGNELPYYSNHIANVGLSYDLQPWLFNLNGYAQSGQYTDNANTEDLTVSSGGLYSGRTPGFAYWNMSLSRDFRLGETDATLTAGINNMFDQRYYSLSGVNPYSAGIQVGQPRNAYLEASLRF